MRSAIRQNKMQFLKFRFMSWKDDGFKKEFQLIDVRELQWSN